MSSVELFSLDDHKYCVRERVMEIEIAIIIVLFSLSLIKGGKCKDCKSKDCKSKDCKCKDNAITNNNTIIIDSSGNKINDKDDDHDADHDWKPFTNTNTIIIDSKDNKAKIW
jgi:ribose 5-phosphate isomerase